MSEVPGASAGAGARAGVHEPASALALPLGGRWALVTGASRGIGAEVARRFVADGARVVLLARSEGALDALVTELGEGAVSVVCDVGDAEAVTRASSRVTEVTGGGPEIIVNNAGSFLIAPVRDTTVAQFRSTLEINLTAPFAFVRAFLPAMLERGRGHVVTVGSIADRNTFPGNAAYAASKYGLRALHEVMRAELRGTGVRTSLVSPGPVDTELWDAVDPDNTPGFTPRSKMLSAGDVAEGIRYVVGAPMNVNVDELRLSCS